MTETRADRVVFDDVHVTDAADRGARRFRWAPSTRQDGSMRRSVARFFLKWRGERPVHRLKACVKFVRSAYPSSAAISLTDTDLSRSRRIARSCKND